eukprot:1504396-Amphidinium_carterae.1
MSCPDVCYYAEHISRFAQPRVLEFLSSDHAPLLLELSTPTRTKAPRRRIRWHVSKADWPGFQLQLDQALLAAEH